MNPAIDLKKIANTLRADVLRMVYDAGAGHVAGPLSSADLFALLYFGGAAKLDPNNPWWEERDRIVLSCGHYCPVLYASLARAGYFPTKAMTTFMKAGSPTDSGINSSATLRTSLPGHPEYRSAPGVEVSAGPLGQGMSVATGMALALKLKYGHWPRLETPRVICILSDGEIQEGQAWEAFNFAVRRQLDNLIFIMDRNRIQIEHHISEVATYGEVAGRLEAFGLLTLETNGHDTKKLADAMKIAKEMQGGPVMMILNTTAGKGVSYMEGKPEWHDKVPSKEQLETALTELREV